LNSNDKSARVLEQSWQQQTKRDIGYFEELITKLLITDKLLTNKQERQQTNTIILKDIRKQIIEDKEFKSGSFDDYLNILNIINDLLYINELE